MTHTMKEIFQATPRKAYTIKEATRRTRVALIGEGKAYRGLPARIDQAARARVEMTLARQLKSKNLADRLIDHRVAKYTAEIHARGGEGGIDSEHGFVPLKIINESGKMALLYCDAYVKYGPKTYYKHLAYLCGHEDNGLFARRVPATCKTVGVALASLEPAEVSRAKCSGRKTWRQGDLYIIEMTRDRADDSYESLPWEARQTHIWNPTGRTLRHTGGHTHIRFGKCPIKFVMQNTTSASRNPNYAD